MSDPIALTDDNFSQEVLSADTPVLVDFWAAWCGPCRMVAPIVEELAKEYAGRAKICKLDVDDAQKTAGEYGIRSIPTLLIFKDGKVTDQVIGQSPKPRLPKSSTRPFRIEFGQTWVQNPSTRQGDDPA